MATSAPRDSRERNFIHPASPGLRLVRTLRNIAREIKIDLRRWRSQGRKTYLPREMPL